MPNTPSKNLDLLTIGDCSIDLFMQVPSGAQGIEETTRAESPQMCFYHGSKIMVESFKTFISGNSINVGIGAKILGLDIGIYSEMGDDQNAERIKNELTKKNIDTSLLIKNTGTETALHTVIVYAGERTIFSYHGKHDYKIKNWGTPKFIYYTSLGDGFEDFQKELVEYIKKNPDVGLIFNPGTFQMSRGVSALKNVLEICDILFVNKEEAAILTSESASSALKDLHEKLSALGTKLSVITDSKNGASAFDGTNFFQTNVYSDDRQIIDKTGAGDAFSAGFVSAIIYGKKLEEALRWGVINSGCQIKVAGAVEGMLTKTQLEKLYERSTLLLNTK